MAEPKCPSCGIEGIDRIISEESEQKSKEGGTQFEVAYCDNCGYIYGVFAKHVLSHEVRHTRPSAFPSVGG
jgi:uncharacterized Zn finger protein